ncbi:S1 family peptidase [Streptomyces lincolnensis]|uniref:trypsin-like peptidase domain-containing protein n=1 Tax=Streptomyces lincolnensis TaxID=1915 RepID=UPI001E388780|nr:trypsin-like peptidase domain-containing protein [Streptomyces lincolnensis]MCD7442752.1 S1 family peptidase [Streptomyces lincolnensis]
MLDDIRSVKQRVEDEFLDRPGVMGVDIGYKERRGRRTDTVSLRVLVEEKHDVPPEQRVPGEIDGVVTDVIERGAPRFLADTTRYDPLVGGISGGTCGGVQGLGTLGAVVRDVATGTLGMLSNWHVLVGGVSGPQGLFVAQPGPGEDGGSCQKDVVGQVTKSAINEFVDCAVLRLNTARPAINAIQDFGPLHHQPTMAALLGHPVVKRGRTSWLTYGTIDAVDATLTLDNAGAQRVFRRQIGIWRVPERNRSFALPGDSGSVVLDRTNRRVVGLLFAAGRGTRFTAEGSYGYANPIASVLHALGVEIFAPKVKEKEQEKDDEKDDEKLRDKIMKEKDRDTLDASAEDRLSRLETAVGDLQHFIEARDRRDDG